MTEQAMTSTTWTPFFQQQGAHFTANSADEIDFFDASKEQQTLPDNFIAPLLQTGLLLAEGEEAATFLHKQLTNDVEHLSESAARLAGYCTAKGRLLATFLMWKNNQQIMLEIPKALLAPIQKRLRMFVLRSKVTLTDISETHIALGLAGKQIQQQLSHVFPTLPTTAYEKITTDAGTLICLPQVNQLPRYQLITSAEGLQQHWDLLTQVATPVSERFWAYTDILAGTPWITPATQETFVPQMINFELIGGVNFKKGCYPGQEIVARTQYLGKVKRRMALFQTDAKDITAGTELFSSNDPGQPCGTVVNAISLDNNTSAVLAEMKLAALLDGTIHVASAAGAPLTQLALPYAIQSEDIHV